ncbi:MAG: hypothetical protein ISQ91_00160 [Candidatus Pelagibacter bacterium]|nr:hypothetical protein [Candidatus Pelagibacter bacterium]
MIFFKTIFLILIVFLKTETLLSENNLFNVNNIQIEKKEKSTNDALANQAIKIGFNQLVEKILLAEDIEKINDLKFTAIKQLVNYYRVSKDSIEKNKELVNFSIKFDKDKMHDLFYRKGIRYSEITDKDLYILPILIKNEKLFIFNNNFFYKNWNINFDVDLLEFILPLENIEIIQIINKDKDNLVNLAMDKIFKEYSMKNLALIIIEENNNNELIYLKTKIQNKNISKKLNLKKNDLETKIFYEKIITETKKEIINLVKSENLIDISSPLFLNTRFNLSKKSNFNELKTRIKNIELIENIFVKDFNKDYMNLRIKYLGKFQNIINQLKNQNIDLKMINDQWVIKIF